MNGIDHRRRAEHELRARKPPTAPTALPGSHSSVPCAPRWISASMRSLRGARDRTRHRRGAARASGRDTRPCARPGRRGPAAPRRSVCRARRKRKRNAPSISARIGGGVAPRAADGARNVRRASRRARLVFGERQRRRSSGPSDSAAISAAASQSAADVVAGRAQSLGDGDGARRRVEADGVAGAAALAGIVGQHAGEALRRRRRAPQPRPGDGEFGDEGDAVGERLVRDGANSVAASRGLAALKEMARGQDPPVDLRQRDMHREIGGPRPRGEARQALDPTPASTTCSTGASATSSTVAFAFVEPGGEGGGVEDDVEGLRRDEFAQRRERRLVLEARHIDAATSRSRAAQARSASASIGCKVVGEIDRAVEDDERPRRARRRVDTGGLETAEGADRLAASAQAAPRRARAAMKARQAAMFSGPPSSK